MNKKSNGFDDINLAEEIDRSSGSPVDLRDVNLELNSIDGNEPNVLSKNWTMQSNGFTGATTTDEKFILPSFAGGDEAADGRSFETSEDLRRDQKGNFDNKEIPSGTSRDRIERAINGEEKKGKLNPRVMKVAAVAAAIVLVAIIFIVGMSGEKRKSIFSKNGEGQTASENENVEETTSDTATDDTRSDRANGDSMKFGDVRVGDDPNADKSSGDKTSSTDPDMVSTEDMKSKEITDSTNPPTNYPFVYGNNSYSNPSSSTTTAAAATIPTENDQSEQSKISSRRNLQQVQLSTESDDERFGVVLRAGQNSNDRTDRTEIQTENSQTQTINNEQITRGTRLSLMLDEPIRSGIATAVTAKLKTAVTNRRGETILPAGTLVVIPISAQITNSRIFNEKESPIQLVTPDGQNYEINGSIKDLQGFAGLSGKVTKRGSKKNALRKIGGAISEVSSVLPGGRILSGAQNGIENYSTNDLVTNASEIVEVSRGTSFYLVIGY